MYSDDSETIGSTTTGGRRASVDRRRPPITQARVSRRLAALATPNPWKVRGNARRDDASSVYSRSAQNQSGGGSMTVSDVSPAALRAQCSLRLEHLARSPLRTLVDNRAQFSFKGSEFVERMDEKINQTLNSMYYQDKSLTSLARDEYSEQSSKGSRRQRGHSTEWCRIRSQPKRCHSQQSSPPRSVAPLDVLQDRLQSLSQPKHITRKVSESSGSTIPSNYVKPSALTYECSERIASLAEQPARYSMIPPPFDPNAISPSALSYEATPRLAELAQPKNRFNDQNYDVTDKYGVHPGALKYVATARLQQLSKPKVR